MKSNCINCKFYKVKDALTGYCRVLIKETGDKKAEQPMVRDHGSCPKWIDCGQQYHIRLGWIKAFNRKQL
ncbi:hypothetical protein BMS3Bbin14_01410 [bacterium BMS3Bbin14]|nr:hypothetical protein BMS3Abin13_00780 [bacterium BMS3Abin13]GBE52931.1 hypothetical protein BMS3Bbin14_01410 [bacterium BMS3Bbin14]HDO30978.1 hypothetical protein [Desulfobacteraceae bacterium]